VEGLGEWLHISDPEGLEIILSTVIAIFIKGDPLWLLVVGESGGGKTEALNGFIGAKQTEAVGTITENTLISGFPTIPIEGDLISKLNGKLLIVKDMAPLLSTKQNVQKEIMTDLRDAYDGYVNKRWGAPRTNEETGVVEQLTKEWSGRFGLIAASTHTINQAMIVAAQMGERYTRINYRVSPIAQIMQSLENQGYEAEMRSELKGYGQSFLNYYETLTTKLGPAPLEATVALQMTHLANATAILRTPVSMDKNSNDLRYTPHSEVGARLGKQFLVQLRSHALLDERAVITSEDIDQVYRVATDCVPQERTKVLIALLHGNRTTTEVENFTRSYGRIPNKSAERELYKLSHIGIIQRVDKNWRIVSEWQERLEMTGLNKYLTELLPTLEEQHALSM